MYLGRSGGDSTSGLIWRDGSSTPLAIVPSSANASVLAVGSAQGYDGRLARLRLGGTPHYAGYYSFMQEINSAGDAVGSLLYVNLGTVARALWWRPGDAQPTNLPGPARTSAWGIDDLGYKVGNGSDSQGQQRRELVWDANGQLVRQFGPYTDSETELYLRDIDNGVALATRYHPNGTKDLALVDVWTRLIEDLKVFGSTAVVAGYSTPADPFDP